MHLPALPHLISSVSPILSGLIQITKTGFGFRIELNFDSDPTDPYLLQKWSNMTPKKLLTTFNLYDNVRNINVLRTIRTLVDTRIKMNM